MFYQSTRGQERVRSAQAIAQGIACDGGLFVPEDFPVLTKTDLGELVKKDYLKQAVYILQKYLTDYSSEEIIEAVQNAYDKKRFPNGPVACRKVKENLAVLELWHGPTFAFKDMALQLLPQLLTKAIAKSGKKEEIVILVATSGDTGKAALEGFANIAGTRIIVFYPEEGVSEIQKLQMTTQQGENVHVLAVEGNFDDAQTGVKKIFQNKELAEKMHSHGLAFSSANSINWGRLVPQIIYYFSAYSKAVQEGWLKLGEKINFVVPTGNFGNILAGFYAKCMGLPVAKFICASNSNNVLSDFLQTGCYNRQRNFHKTISPSMDILVSSNLERLLYQLTGGDSDQVKKWLNELEQQGSYTIGKQYQEKLQENFFGAWVDDSLTRSTIKKVFTEENYLLDTHTAVAWQALEEYQAHTQAGNFSIVVSTASPYKFAADVLQALTEQPLEKDAFTALEKLSELSGLPIPPAMQKLKTAPTLHQKQLSATQMKECVEQILKI